jgi:hypothetical protein
MSDGGILCPMLDDVRKYVRAGIEAVAPGRSEEIAATVISRAQTLGEQMSSLATGFLEWSAEARGSLMHEVKDLIARQVSEMGLATKQELEALRRRLERLEKKLSAEPTGRPKPSPSTRKATPKGPTRSAGSGRR